MKKRILTIAALLFLAIMIPLTVNAATISAEPQNMEVGEEVTVTVEIDTADVESVQFDLKFDWFCNKWFGFYKIKFNGSWHS